MSQILVSCETPIQWEQLNLFYIRNTCSIWYFIQFVCIAIFMSLHAPVGTCTPVASASPIQYNMHCHVHKRIYTRMFQSNLRIPQLVGFAPSPQRGCKIVCQFGQFFICGTVYICVAPEAIQDIYTEVSLKEPWAYLFVV